MTPAGWYDDPLIPGGKRFWDGNQWTDQAQPPPAPPGARGPLGPGGPIPPGSGVPQPATQPFAQPAGQGAGYSAGPGGQAVYTGTGINELGDWIRRSFSMVFQRFSSLSALYVPQLILGALAYLLLDQSLRGAVITDDGDFLGFNVGLIWAAVIVFVVSAIVGLITHLAGHHNLYAGHVGQHASVGQSFSAGLRSLFRYIGVLILLYLAMFVLFGVLFGIGIGLSVLAGDNGGGLFVLALIIGYLAFIVLTIWLSVKLAFITVGSVVIPKGTSVIKTSWRITDGHFWGIFGRQLLLGLIVSMIGMVVYFVTYLAMIALVFTQFGLTEDGRFTVDGQDIETLSIFEFSDFLPNPILVVAMFSVLGFMVYIIQAVVYSGTAALYADLRGPNIFGHGRRQQTPDW